MQPVVDHASPPRTPDPIGSSINRSTMLDVLRAIAVLLVIFRHVGPPTSTAAVPEPFYSFFKGLSDCGWIGVDLFFVLSGFLISGLLFAEYRERQRLDLPRFFIRRGFKIYPPFVFFLVVSVLIQTFYFKVPFVFYHEGGIPPQLWPELCFLQNYRWAYWNHTWSLAVEEHFYILLPILLWAMWRSPRADELSGAASKVHDPNPFRAMPVALIVILLTTFLWRAEMVQRWPIETADPAKSAFQIIRHTTPTHLRIDSLMVGVFVGYCYHFHRYRFLRSGRRLWWLALPIAAYGISTGVTNKIDSNYMVLFGFPVLAISFAMAIWILLALQTKEFFLRPLTRASAKGKAKSRLELLGRVFRPVAFMGKYSYSIYLWHMPAIRWGTTLLFPALKVNYNSCAGNIVRLMIAIVGSILLGVIAAMLVEGPALRLRNRLFPSHTRAKPVSTHPHA